MLTLISALDATLARTNAAQGRIRSNVVCVSTAKIEMSRVLLPLTGAKRIGSNRVVRFRDAFGLIVAANADPHLLRPVHAAFIYNAPLFCGDLEL